MRPSQWKTFQTVAKGRNTGAVPVALIVDSPWMPGHFGIGHLDYYLDGNLWFESNRRVIEEFPEVIMFPSWWVEYGMAIEPSAAGSRIHFHANQPPGQTPILFRLEDAAHLAPVNPSTDGLMPFALRQYRTMKQRIFDAGYTIPVVAARGPLCMASFLRGVTEFMMDTAVDPAGVHKLLRFTTDTVIRWLKAQAEAIGETVSGIFVLDDIPGMLSRNSYLEFAHPYLKEISDAFPAEWVKVYHNDANTRPFLSDIAGAGFDVLNWTHKIPSAQAREKLGPGVCLMGNVAPLELGVNGSAEQVKAAALDALGQVGGEGIILSVGGGVSPGMPAENVRALAEAAAEFQRGA